MSRWAWLGTAATVLLMLSPVAAGAASSTTPAWHTWTGTPTNIYRQATLDHGEFIYSNGIFQSRGANADVADRHRTDYFPGGAAPDYSIPRDLYNAYTYDFFGAHRSTYNGTYHLPTDHARWPDFTGDMAELRLAVDGTDLFVRMQFTSFPSPDAQIATLAFADATTPGAAHPWPHNAGVSSPWSTSLTLWGTGAAVDSGGSTQSLNAAGGAFRTGDHVLEARVPLSALPQSKWTLTGGSGLDDPTSPGQYWTVPSGAATSSSPGTNSAMTPGANVWDLLFSRDTPWTFDERRQGDDLRSGIVTSDTQAVDPAQLSARATNPAPLTTGDFSRFFASSIGSADGIDRSAGLVNFPPPGVLPGPVAAATLEDFDVTYHYLGSLQPYYMHVPASYATHTSAMPLIVYLHGFTGLPDEPFYNPVGLVPMADQKGYLLASALGRGDYSYKGPGDIDVKEVITDVEKHYDVDPNRIYLMGHSMGGYGTNNVGIHNPDLFAAIAPAEGTDSIDLHQNLLNVPWLEMTAEEDLDTTGAQAKKLYGDLSADGYDATLVDYKFKIHEYSSIYDTLARIFDFYAAHKRNPNPPVVSYSRLPGDDVPAIGLVYDHAYWLSGLRVGDTTKRSDTRVESLGIQHAALNPAAAAKTDTVGTEPGPTNVPRTLRELFQTTPAYGATLAVQNAASIEATNTSALTLELQRMGLRDDCTLMLDVKTDRPLAINLGNRMVGAPAGTSVQTVGSGVCAASTTTTGSTPNTGTRPPMPIAAIATLALMMVAGLALGISRRHGTV